jgi:hypothetical protein
VAVDAVQMVLEESRRAQGFPPDVEDRAAIERIVTLLFAGEDLPAPKASRRAS